MGSAFDGKRTAHACKIGKIVDVSAAEECATIHHDFYGLPYQRSENWKTEKKEFRRKKITVGARRALPDLMNIISGVTYD